MGENLSYTNLFMSGRVWSPLLDLQVCELCHFCKEFRVSRYCGLQKLLDLILVVVLAFIFIFWLWVILMMVGEAKQGKDQGWASPWMWKSSEHMHTEWWILLQITTVTLRAFLCTAKWRLIFLHFFPAMMSLFELAVVVDIGIVEFLKCDNSPQIARAWPRGGISWFHLPWFSLSHEIFFVHTAWLFAAIVTRYCTNRARGGRRCLCW